MKKMLFAAALVAALIPFAAAQDSHRAPQANLDREVDVQVPARAAVLGNPPREVPGAPKYCKPCLMYAGDFDSNASDANGLANEIDVVINTGAATYAPFKVPSGKTWTVTGLLTDDFLSADVLDPATSPYEVRKGIPAAGGTGWPAGLWLLRLRGFGKGCPLQLAGWQVLGDRYPAMLQPQ